MQQETYIWEAINISILSCEYSPSHQATEKKGKNSMLKIRIDSKLVQYISANPPTNTCFIHSKSFHCPLHPIKTCALPHKINAKTMVDVNRNPLKKKLSIRTNDSCHLKKICSTKVYGKATWLARSSRATSSCAVNFIWNKELTCHTIHRVHTHLKNVLNRATKEHLFTQKILNRKTNNTKLNQKSKTKD